MYQLHVLGTPQLTRTGSAEAVPVGRQVMALLAALAIAGRRGLTRDRIAALFWDESDERQASQSLRQLLYRVRQLLGQEIVRGDHTLSLNDSLIEIDLWQFRAAVSRSDPAGAVASNGGVLLDGFHLPGEAGLGEWVEEERSRITRALRGLLEGARTASVLRGDVEEAIAWSNRLVADDPLDTGTAVAHAHLLRDTGSRDRAIRFLRQHRARVEHELGGAPAELDHELEALHQYVPLTEPPRSRHAPDRPLPLEASIEPLPATVTFRRHSPRMSAVRLTFAAGMALLAGTGHGAGARVADRAVVAAVDSAPVDLSSQPPMPVIAFGSVASRDTAGVRIAGRAAERALWSFRQQEGWASAQEESAVSAEMLDAVVRFEARSLGDSVRLKVWYDERSAPPALLEDVLIAAAQVDSGVGKVRDRLFGTLALSLYPRFRDWPASAITRNAEAARAFAKALRQRAWSGDPLAGNVGLAEAVSHDPEFDLAKMLMVEEYLAASSLRPVEYFNGRADVRADSLLPHLRSRSSRMDPFELRFLDMLEQFARPSSWDIRVAAIEAVREHAPESPVLRRQHAEALFASRRASESLRILDSIDLGPLGEHERYVIVMLRAANLHALGRFEQERELAGRVLESKVDPPRRWYFNLIHLRARAGMHEAGLEHVIDSLMRDPMEFGPSLVAQVADEMIAHRMPVMGAMVKTALATPENARFLRTRKNFADHDGWIYWRAVSLARGEQFGPADSLLNDPSFSPPDSMRMAWMGLSGTVAAHVGDSLRARRIDRRLAECVGLDCPEAFAWRSRIAAALFDHRRAEELLDSAYVLGYPFSIELHADAEFRAVNRIRAIRGVAEVR